MKCLEILLEDYARIAGDADANTAERDRLASMVREEYRELNEARKTLVLIRQILGTKKGT